MRGIIRGFKLVDYPKKDNKLERVQGIELHMTYTSGEVYGESTKTEFVSKVSPFYKKFFEPYLSDDLDGLIGAKIFIDYNTEKRGNFTFTEIADMEVTPAEVR
ncbi:MAG: hypothetical protein NC078_05000 [Ruminococcus sp.]|nr:hypothetical protein [Ruminococcus sp.]